MAIKPNTILSNLYRAVRRGTAWKSLRGQEPFHWVQPEPGLVELGSQYGRWAVRIEGLSPTTTLMSFGLGQDITFEQALIQACGCRVIGFDPTPASVAWLAEQPPIPGLSTHAVALAPHDGTLMFALPPDAAADQVSASALADYGAGPRLSVPCVTLEGAKRLAGVSTVDLLKLDIEGAEYAVLDQALDTGALEGVSQLMVEVHHFLPGLHAHQTRRLIDRLGSAGFRIGWVGRTNHEYLFLRDQR